MWAVICSTDGTPEDVVLFYTRIIAESIAEALRRHHYYDRVDVREVADYAVLVRRIVTALQED